MDIEPGTQLPLRFAWSPSTGMVRATYRVEVESYEPRGDRFQCQLLELVEASGVRSGGELTQEMLDGLVGQHVRVPRRVRKFLPANAHRPAMELTGARYADSYALSNGR